MKRECFAALPIGAKFELSGNTVWVKRSSRTAYIENAPKIWFYFRRVEGVSVR